MRTIVSALILVLSTVAVQPRVTAQEPHAASPSAIDAALAQHAASAETDRDAVLRVLQHPEVARLAGRLGLDLTRAETVISTLNGQDLADLAANARQVDQALAGGATVTITTTMIIIGLLVLILLIVALK